MSLAKRLADAFVWLAQLGRISCRAAEMIDYVHAVNNNVHPLNGLLNDRAVACLRL
jgi:hypothetical protein